MGCVNHASIDLELGEGIVDLGGGELVAEGHQLGSEGLGVDLAVLLEGLEGSEDDIVIVGSTSHLGGEQGDHLGEVHGSVHLVEHGLENDHEMDKENEKDLNYYKQRLKLRLKK